MGLSTVAGWGAFLHAPARKDQLLGEYTGELITQAEADRRCGVHTMVSASNTHETKTSGDPARLRRTVWTVAVAPFSAAPTVPIRRCLFAPSSRCLSIRV